MYGLVDKFVDRTKTVVVQVILHTGTHTFLERFDCLVSILTTNVTWLIVLIFCCQESCQLNGRSGWTTKCLIDKLTKQQKSIVLGRVWGLRKNFFTILSSNMFCSYQLLESTKWETFSTNSIRQYTGKCSPLESRMTSIIFRNRFLSLVVAIRTQTTLMIILLSRRLILIREFVITRTIPRLPQITTLHSTINHGF